MTDNFVVFIFVCFFSLFIAVLGGLSKKKETIVYLKVVFLGLGACMVGIIPVFTGESLESIVFLDYRLGFARAFPVGLAIFFGGVGAFFLQNFRNVIRSFGRCA